MKASQDSRHGSSARAIKASWSRRRIRAIRPSAFSRLGGQAGHQSAAAEKFLGSQTRGLQPGIEVLFHLGQIETVVAERGQDHGGTKQFLKAAQFHAGRDGVAAHLGGRGHAAAGRGAEVQTDQMDALHGSGSKFDVTDKSRFRRRLRRRARQVTPGTKHCAAKWRHLLYSIDLLSVGQSLKQDLLRNRSGKRRP